jgi:hypothetical protein
MFVPGDGIARMISWLVLPPPPLSGCGVGLAHMLLPEDGIPLYPNRDGSRLSNIKILITLSYGEGCVRSQEFMTEDLSEKDIVGLVLGFEAVAVDGAVGSSASGPSFQVGRGSRRRRKRTWGVGGRWVLTALGEGKLFNDRRAFEGLNKFPGVGQERE